MKTIVPGSMLRIPTGVLQFGDDWPGVFIRGDEALALANRLEMCAADHALLTHTVGEFVQFLRECRVATKHD